MIQLKKIPNNVCKFDIYHWLCVLKCKVVGHWYLDGIFRALVGFYYSNQDIHCYTKYHYTYCYRCHHYILNKVEANDD